MNPSDPIADHATNKTVALHFLECAFAGRMEEAIALLTPDAIWWVLGDPDKVKVAGRRDMTRIPRFLRNVLRGFPEGLDVRFEGVTAEGERVAVEAVSSGRMSDGRLYRNRYHFLVKLRDGKVFEMREYLDTQYAYEVQQASEPPPR